MGDNSNGYRNWKWKENKQIQNVEERRTKKIPSLKFQLTDDVEAVVTSSTGRWGWNFLDRSERRGRVGEGRRREGKRELGAERERERERSERRGGGKGREAKQERVESERERESSETRSTGASGGWKGQREQWNRSTGAKGREIAWLRLGYKSMTISFYT